MRVEKPGPEHGMAARVSGDLDERSHPGNSGPVPAAARDLREPAAARTPPTVRTPTLKGAAADAAIRDLAAHQHGVVTRAQLRGAGLPAHIIEHRLGAGRLVALHHGVYRATALRSPLEAEMAAVLACGETAVLSHYTAGAHQALLRQSRATRGRSSHETLARPSFRNGAAPVEITVRGCYRSRGGGIRVHRLTRLDPDEITTFEGIPITTPARTILDIAPKARPRELEQAVAKAEREGLATLADIARLLDRYPRRPGTPALRAILAMAGGPAFVRSEGESRLLDLVRRAGLPPPRVNATVAALEADFVWEDRKVIVELDGYAYHSSRRAFERDHQRDAILEDAGYRVMRVTWKQLVDEPEKVLTRIIRALSK